MRVTGVLGVIPARGGSKGIPRKNLVPLGGRPLLLHTTDAAVSSGVCERVVVSSDDEEVLALALGQPGVEAPFRRPPALAGDDSPTADTVRHLLSWLEREDGYVPDSVMLLEPTCPLRTAEDIRAAHETYRRGAAPCLLTVSPPLQHPNDFIRREGDGWTYCLARPMRFHGRQDFLVTWFVNGAIYITRTDFLTRTGLFYDLAQAAVYEMAAEHSFDIDTPFDLELAEAWLRLSSKQDGESHNA